MRFLSALGMCLAVAAIGCSDYARSTWPNQRPKALQAATADWSGAVGILYNANDAVVGVLYPPAPWEGHWVSAWHSPAGDVRRGKCLAGSQPGANGNTKLYCIQWDFSRSDPPAGSGVCGSADCRWAFADVQGQLYGAQDVQLQFIIETPLQVTISGPAQPITTAGTYTWTANPTGGDGQTYAYRWEYSTDSATWSDVGTSRSYSRTLSVGAPSFYLRVTVNSFGTQKAVVQPVSVDITIPPLTVSIDGPSVITAKGTYTWTANPAGGSGVYAYQWAVTFSGMSPTQLGNQQSQSMTVYGGDPDFYMRVTLTASGSTAVDSLFVKNCIGLGTGCYAFRSADPLFLATNTAALNGPSF